MGFPKLLRDIKERLNKYGFHIGTINGVPQENGNYFFIADKDYIIGGGDGFCHYEVIKGNYKRVPHNAITVDGIKCCKTNHGMGYFFFWNFILSLKTMITICTKCIVQGFFRLFQVYVLNPMNYLDG
ncbi:MAG: hypothetical protein K2M99_00675 [Treponemataceae bacterium]|nr:hypothetical protein [Treponemataceae bacterium]